jgi:hypothetical protein
VRPQVMCMFEVLGGRVGNESGSHGIHMPIAIAALLMSIEALRHDHCARHRDVELLLT